jgi:hypothetical protein
MSRPAAAGMTIKPRSNVMRAAAFAFALMLSGTAVAQTANTTGNMDPQTPAGATGDVATQADTATTTTTTDTAMATAPAAGAVVEPSNANPKRDARGIPVISQAAVVPIGYNGVQGVAMGGPEVDPATGQTIDTSASYPPCTRTVTDKCLQTYERHRAR